MAVTRIRKPASKLVAGLLGGMLAAWLTVPMIAFAEQSASDVEMQDEAWFFKHRQPAEQLPDEVDDAITDPSGNELDAIAKATVRDGTGEVYAGEFLRVGTVFGEEEARAYITLPTAALGDGLDVIITGGTVTLVAAPTSPEEPPEDADPESEDANNAAAPNQRNVENADMIACLTLEFVVADLGGDWADRPDIDCDVRSPLELVENPEHERPTWTVDLEPFVGAWDDPLNNFGIAIIANPDTEASEPEQNWHVAFPNRFNALAEPSPFADVSYREQDLGFDDDFDDDFDDAGFEDDGGFDDSGFDDGGSGGGFDSAPAQDFDSGGPSVSDNDFDDEPQPEPEVADDEPVEEEPVEEEPVMAAPADETGVRTNPALALLPLLGLGLAAMLGYSLTKEPELSVEREGAVSKLMERRQVSGPTG